MSSQTTRFIGASIARMPGSVIEQLLGMRRRIRDFNVPRGLRTALLYSGGWFVQWHEGPADAIDRTWAISRAHPGHYHPRAVHRSQGVGALHEPVQVTALVGPDKPTDIARKLYDLDAYQKELALEPVDIWRRLAAPPAGRFLGAAAGEHRVIAVVSEFTESVEVVKALAEHFRVPMNYMRFAGPDTHIADVGAAYVDLGWQGGRTRVQALSPLVLRFGIARLSLSRLDSVVLLANRRADSAAALAGAASPFIAGFRPEPAVHVLRLDGRSHLDAVLDFVAGAPSTPHGETS